MDGLYSSGDTADTKVVVENGTKENVNGQSERHSSHHKDKHRDKDRDRHRSDKDREKDKHRHSSSHKDKDRDKDRHRDKDKEHKSSSSSKDKDRHSSSHRDKDRERKDRDNGTSSSRDKDRHSSSHKDKDRHRDDRDKHRSSSNKEHRSKDGDREKHREKDRDRSDKEKDRDRSDKEKDRDRSDKEKEAAREKEKEREMARQREKELAREREREEQAAVMEVKVEIKDEEQDEEEESTVDDFQEKLEVTDIKDETVEDDDDDVPLTMRDTPNKRAIDDDEDEEDTPLFARVKKLKKEDRKKSKKRKRDDSDEEEDDFKPKAKSKTKNKTAVKTETTSPRKGKKKEEEEVQVWKWWEEKKRDDGTKWQFLEHKGPVFAPEYEPLPSSIKFYYDGKEMRLSQDAEEVATFYAKMLQHDYTSKEVFNTNFMNDWRKCMSEKERAIIKELSKCNFKKMADYFTQKSEERKAMSKDEKLKIKEENEALQKEYGFCTIDGHKEKIGNFRIEPPGLFRGRGEHPKMGMLKRRVLPKDVMINCSKDSKIPVAPDGKKWKKVQHDNTVTWLASWTENVQGNVKYVMLNPSSKLKGEKDMIKYEVARKLAKKIDQIRTTYIADWKSKEMRIRQRAVALYFIDRLALRAGNEKDEDQADTVGCCSLRVEHVSLKDELNGKECVVVFDFLGKDSIRYYNEVPVEKRVYKNLKLFMENKKPGDDLFDRLNTTVLNKHLGELMEGLSAKVFRTYNASITLQNQLNELTKEDYSVPEKILAYNRANRAVAILCNHQRSVPKSHEKSMEGLKAKIEAKRDAVDEAKKEYKAAKRGGDRAEQAKKKLDRLKDQLMKLEVQETDKEENKTIALGTSKLNYLDPRISVAWCKKHDVPIEKVYNKTQRDKFRWAIEMAGPDYVF